jgi:hypothetical protein
MNVNQFLGLGRHDTCPHIYSALGRLIARNGVTHVKRYCTNCNRILTGSIKTPAHERDRLPLIRDNREIYGATPPAPCDRCGTLGPVETHHWAPWALFDDANDWPTSELCPPCHRLWHRVVTPNINRRIAG